MGGGAYPLDGPGMARLGCIVLLPVLGPSESRLDSAGVETFPILILFLFTRLPL